MPGRRRGRTRTPPLSAAIRAHPIRAAVLTLAAIAVAASAIPIPSALVGIALAATLGVLWLLLLRRLELDAGVIGILAAGLAVYVLYLTYTDPTERSYDAYDQLFYISTIFREGRLPDVTSCMICHHPPLYYVVAALWLKATEFSKGVTQALRLQVLSLVLFQIFVVTCVVTWRRFGVSRQSLRLATALLVFWPYSILMSVRVHDDLLAAALITLSISFALEWFDTGDRRTYFLALGACAASILTKTSGLVMAAGLVGLAAWKARETKATAVLRQVLPVTFAVVAGAALLAAWNKTTAEPHPPSSSLCFRFFGQACSAAAGDPMRVANHPWNYLGFDVRGFVSAPFIIATRPETGTTYFLTDLFKSSLFGTYASAPDAEMNNPPNVALARALNVLLFAMIVFVAAGTFKATRSGVRRYRALGFLSALLILSVAALRAALPMAHHVDFRFVFALLLPACLVYVETVERFRDRAEWLRKLGIGLALAFIAASVAFFVPKARLSVTEVRERDPFVASLNPASR